MICLGTLLAQPAKVLSQTEPEIMEENHLKHEIYLAQITAINLDNSTLTLTYADNLDPYSTVSAEFLVTENSALINSGEPAGFDALIIDMTVNATYIVDENGQKIIQSLIVIE
jgi:hypothetical protein